jgi:hypothetical protein
MKLKIQGTQDRNRARAKQSFNLTQLQLIVFLQSQNKLAHSLTFAHTLVNRTRLNCRNWSQSSDRGIAALFPPGFDPPAPKVFKIRSTSLICGWRCFAAWGGINGLKSESMCKQARRSWVESSWPVFCGSHRRNSSKVFSTNSSEEMKESTSSASGQKRKQKRRVQNQHR